MFICPNKLPWLSIACAAWIASTLSQPTHAEDDAQALVRLKSEMQHIAGDGGCSNVVHCRVVTMGFDACGNPTAALVYNHVRDVDNELRAKAAEYTFIEEEQQRGKAKPADCKKAREPKLVCVNNRCKVGDTSY